MHLTVALCTWNRAPLLERSLDHLTRLAIPDDASWDLVVVDNGSVDHTADVVAAFADRLPLRALDEPRPGLSHARNAAVRVARGDYLLWIDDDILVDADWLASYAAAFRAHPDAVLFGGPIAPEFDGAPPAWLRAALPDVGNAYALLDLGPAPRPLAGDALPFGANYAIRADAQHRHHYDPRLGRCRDRLVAGEETAVALALLSEGHAGWWVPGARVRHVIPAERQSLRYLRSYYLGNAASGAQEAVTSAPDAPYVLGRPRWIWRQALENELRYRLHRLLGVSPSVWAGEFRRASDGWGLLRSIDAGVRSAGRPSDGRHHGRDDDRRGDPARR